MAAPCRLAAALLCLPLLAGCMDLFHELRPSRLRRLNHGPGMNRSHFSVSDPVPSAAPPPREIPAPQSRDVSPKRS